MRAWARIGLGVLGLLVLLVAGAYLVWFWNPHQDRLVLDPRAVFGAPDDLLVRNATLIDVEAGTSRPGTSILVRDGLITTVTQGELAAPPRVEVLEAAGKYVLPGLVDVHVHLGTGGLAPFEPLTPLVALEQFVRHGVTTVLVFGGRYADDEGIAKLKARARAGEIVAPAILATGSNLTVRGSHPVSTISSDLAKADAATLEAAGVVLVAEGQDVEPLVRRKAELGLDGLKIIVESGPDPVFGPNPRMSHALAARIVASAERHGLPVYAHATSPDEFSDAVRAGVRAVVHNLEDRPLQDAPWIEDMVAQRIFLAPTLSIAYGFLNLLEPERAGDTALRGAASPRTLRSLDNPIVRLFLRRSWGEFDTADFLETSSANLRKLERAGVPLALGTDSGMPFVLPGYGAHVEMELMQRAGLGPAAVLRAGTLGGAELLGLDGAGRIAPGATASLLVLDADPLEDIRNTRRIHRVVLRGRLIDLAGG